MWVIQIRDCDLTEMARNSKLPGHREELLVSESLISKLFSSKHSCTPAWMSWSRHLGHHPAKHTHTCRNIFQTPSSRHCSPTVKLLQKRTPLCLLIKHSAQVAQSAVYCPASLSWMMSKDIISPPQTRVQMSRGLCLLSWAVKGGLHSAMIPSTGLFLCQSDRLD